VSYATQAISCTPREAGYVPGGVLDNDTALAIREHTSDTHGFIEHLFGLCALLGVAFMPRLKDLPDQVLSRIDRDADYGALQPLLRGRINIELILDQWDQLVRLAASLKDWLTPAHVVMQRLANANAFDRLAGALTQLGRLMKTIHILAKSLFFANQGGFRSGDYEDVMNKARLPQPPVQCRAGLEHRPHRPHCRPAPRRRARGARRGPGPRVATGARPRHPERQPLPVARRGYA